MTYRKFLTSVADVYAYDSNDNILFTGKTLLDSSIEVSLGSSPVRGGVGNKLQYIYYHTGEMTFTLTDTQWNLQMLGETVGSEYELGNYYAEETVTVSGGSGTVTGTPLAFTGTTIYGWATDTSGVTRRVTFTGSTFTTEGADGEYCVRYYKANLSEGQQITISANMIPSVVKLVMETQLNSADVTTNKIGIVQIIAPTVILSGGFSISMTADGIANTPLTGTALAYEGTSTDACETDEYYAKIVEIIDNTNWYDNIYDLSISGGDFSMESGNTQTLVVYAISNAGTSFKAPNSGLTFSSSASPVATVGANTGIVTAVSSGSATISVYVTSASTVDTSAVVTVTA
jgi:hypothetical protein